jgi:hypothetical protein
MKNGMLSPEEAIKAILGKNDVKSTAAGKPAASPVSKWKSLRETAPTVTQFGAGAPVAAGQTSTGGKKSEDIQTNWQRFGKGNIDLLTRPKVKNQDNSISTIRSMSFEEDGQEILVPTVIQKNGKWKVVSDDEAIRHYHDTGKYLGKFNTVADANAYAQSLHESQEKLYTEGMGKAQPFKSALLAPAEAARMILGGNEKTGGASLSTPAEAKSRTAAPAAKSSGPSYSSYELENQIGELQKKKNELTARSIYNRNIDTGKLDEIKEVDQELARLQTQRDQKREEEQSIPYEKKRARWAELAALQRPLTDAEKIEAKAAIKELRGSIADRITVPFSGDEDRKAAHIDNIALAGALDARTSAGGAAFAGATDRIPFVGDWTEEALDRQQEVLRGSGFPGAEYYPSDYNIMRYAPVENPGAYMVGQGVSEVAQTMALGELFKAGTGAVKGFSKLPTLIQRALPTALTFGTKDALDTASEGGSPADIAKAGGIGFAKGTAGSLAADAVGALGGTIIKNAKLKYSIPAAILRDGVSGAAFAGASMGTNMLLDSEYRPTGEEAGKDLAVAFAFSTLGSMLSTIGRTQADKVRMQQYADSIKRDYATIVNNADGKVTLDTLDDLAAKSAQVRAELANNAYLGQKKTADNILEFLDTLDDNIDAARAAIYGGGLEAGTAPTGTTSILPSGGMTPALGAGATQTPAVPGMQILPTAGEISPGTMGGMAAAFLPTAGESDAQNALRPDAGLTTTKGPIEDGALQNIATELRRDGYFTGRYEDALRNSGMTYVEVDAAVDDILSGNKETPEVNKLVSALGSGDATGGSPVSTVEYLPRAGEGTAPEERLPIPGSGGNYIERAVPTEEIQQGIQDAARLLPVEAITGEEFGKGKVDLITQVSDFFERVGGKVENQQLGTVILNRSGVGDDIAHGIGRKKAAAFAAVPAVLEHGKVIDYQANWKGRGYDTAVVAAPITMGGEEYLEGIVLIRRNQTNRFYVHEVLMAKNNETAPFKTGDSPRGEGLPGGAAPSVISLLRQVANVKRELSEEGLPTLQQTDTGGEMEEGRWDSIMGDETLPNPGGVDSGKQKAIDEAAQAVDEWAKATLGTDAAGVRTKMPESPEQTTRGKVREGGRNLYRKFVDSGEAVGRIGKEMGDKSLYAYYNFARASSNAAGNMLAKGGAQTDVWGREVGPSLADIFEPIRAKGDEYYRTFETYLFHRHNVERMSRNNDLEIAKAKEALDIFDEGDPELARLPESDLTERAARGDYEAQARLELLNTYNRAKKVFNKPVFGYGVSAMDSAAESEALERAHPEFEELAEQVYQYSKNLMQYRVDSGLLTREQADHIEEVYPHYVPTYRVTAKDSAKAPKKGKKVSSTIGRAQGGTADLIPLHVAIAQQTMQVVRNGSINRFGGRLLEDYEKDRTTGKKYIYDVGRAENTAHPDYFDQMDDPTPKKENTFTIYSDGKAVQMTVDKTLYEGISALTPSESGIMNADFWKPAEAATSLFKALVTGYNPMFSARNFARDLQEAGLYSKDIRAWMKNYPLAVQEIATNGEWWKRYQALGGVYSSVFDYRKGYKVDEKEHGAVQRNTVDRIEGLNMAIEQAPRLAEFMAQAKKNGENPDSYMDAMLAAADVTTNFGRSGEVGKFLNRTFVPFLNPSIQGIDKAARAFFGKKEGKDWLKLIFRVAALGIAPVIINELLNKDEPGWDTVRQSDKDVNWLISLGDGKYLRIPKGRDMSVAVMALDRVGDLVRGEDVDLGETLRTAANQVAPPNPLENNIIAAWADADLLDPESTGKTWYGGNIENQRLQGYAPGQRFDENTDVISKMVGGALGVSPKKLNYILDQYSGVVGDFVLPLLTPSGNKNPLSPFTKAFVLDSVSSNRLSGEFYDKADEITYTKNAGDGAMSVVQRFWNKQAGAVSDVYARIRDAENAGELPNAEMLEQVRQDKGVINGIQQNALDVLSTFESAVRKYYTGDSDKEKDETYRKANREVFGAEYALQVYNKDVYGRAVKCYQQGVSYEDYYDTYFAMRDLTKTNEKRDVLLEADLQDAEKIVLYRDRISDERDDDITEVMSTGLGFNDFLRAQNEYNTLYNQKGSAAEKGTAFARWMNGQGYTGRQYETLRKAFQFYSQIPNSETIYERFVGAGVDDGTAYDLSEKLSGLEPELGKDQVSALQKGRVIVDSGLDDARKVAALGEVMGEADYLKLSTAYQHSVPPEAYVSYKERLAQVDTNGTITQAEAQWAIDGLDLTQGQKATLWQLQNTSWKSYKNPYSQSAGGQALTSYKSEKSKADQEKAAEKKVSTRYGEGAATGGVQTRYSAGGTLNSAANGIQTRYGANSGYPPTAGQPQNSNRIITRYGK